MEQSLYIAHHGIRGQKWGVRNYQNPDGTLTEEGRRRYGVGKAVATKAKADKYSAKSMKYAFKAQKAYDRYNVEKSNKYNDKSARYAVKAAELRAKASSQAVKEDRLINAKLKTSDVYALEGAKKAGLLGAAAGKMVGVYKEHQERKRDKDRLTEEERKVFDDAAELEKKALYDFSVKDRTASKENVAKTSDQLQNLCDAHFDKLAGAVEAVDGRREVFNQQDAIFEGSFARKLALRFNERFDGDRIFDQHMDEWVQDYSDGLITKQEFKNHYEAELNDHAAWLVDTFKTDELSKIAKTFADGDDRNEPNDSWRAYLKSRGKDDPYQESTAKQNSSGRRTTGSKSWVEEAANDPEHWELIDDTPGERLYKRRDPSKSSGRYKTGAKESSKTENTKLAYLKLHNEGYKPSEIAKRLGQSTKDDGKPSGEIRKMAAKYKINKNEVAFFKGLQRRAQSLKSSGKTIAEIADIMGVSVPSIKDYLYEDFDSLR